MKEHYVTYSQAVKLKELGFDEPCEFYYNPHLEIRRTKTNLLSPQITNNRFLEEIAKGMATAPRLDQAQKWLREEGIFLMIDPRFFQGDALKDVKWCFIIQPLDDIGGQYRSELYGKLFDSYELALSAGIDKALELLTIKKAMENGNRH